MEILYGSGDMNYLRPLHTRFLSLSPAQGHHPASHHSLPCILNCASPQNHSNRCTTLLHFSSLKTASKMKLMPFCYLCFPLRLITSRVAILGCLQFLFSCFLFFLLNPDFTPLYSTTAALAEFTSDFCIELMVESHGHLTYRYLA